MEEPEVVAAVVAGDPAGLAEAIDTYATDLFAYCRSILPEAAASDVVEDTFVVARTKLGGLRDPARIGQWLQAIARNECFRRIMAAGGAPPPEPVTPVPDLALPDGLRGRIMKVCTDDTPAGRAHRTTVAHRSGQFGYDGFPRPVTVARPRRVPRVAVAAAVVVATAAVVVIVVAAMSGGSHPARLTSAGLGNPAGVIPTTSLIASTSPATRANASPHHSAKPTMTLAATRSPHPSRAATSPAAVKTTANPRPTPHRTASSPATHTTSPAQPTPSVSTSTYTPPPNPVLLVRPTSLSLTSVNGAAASGSITIIGFGGTVHWSAAVHAGAHHVAVTPAAGTLKPGASTTVTVIASGTVSFTAHITLMPGDHIVTVKVTAKKVTTKSAGRLHQGNVSSSRREGAVAGP